MLNPDIAIDALREEIQRERFENQRIMAAGFQSLSDKLDAHSNKYDDRFLDLSERVLTIETKANTVGKLVWGLILAFSAASFNWIFSIFKHS